MDDSSTYTGMHLDAMYIILSIRVFQVAVPFLIDKLMDVSSASRYDAH